MRLRIWLAALCFAVGLLAQEHDPPAVQLWAVSDGVRVSPVTGNLIENKPFIHKDYPTGNPREGNLVWDSKSKTVRLRAARNEFAAFQLIIEAWQPQNDFDVKVDHLVHPSGARIGGKHVEFFKEWYSEVRRPSTGYEFSSLGRDWYPDALMPYRRTNWLPDFPFSIPDLYNNIPNQRNHAIWFDIYVPFERSAAPPGRYTGTVEVTWQGGKDTVNVALDVWDFALPHENHVKGDVWNGSIKNMSPGEEMQYYQLAKQHRFLPLIYAYRPGLKVEGTKVELDWTEYDKRLAKYLDGSAFTDKHGYWGPGYGVPVSHLMLPFDIERHGNPATAWPLALPKAGRTPEYEAVWKETGRQVKEHLDRDPRARQVMKVSFLNGLDESYNDESYEKMIYYGRLLQSAMGRDWFKYRIDGGYSWEAMEKLQEVVTLWVAHTVSWDVEKMEHFRNRGVESWFYGPMIYEQRKNSGCGSNTFLDLDLLVNRGIGWIAWKYRSGWVEWELDWNAFAAWYEAENFKEPRRIFNGSGQLIYRGATMGYQQPIASIRLKAQRRGLQDHEYMWLLSQKTGNKDAADKVVNRIVHKNPFGKASIGDIEIWKNNPDEWEKARIEVGEMIAGK